MNEIETMLNGMSKEDLTKMLMTVMFSPACHHDRACVNYCNCDCDLCMVRDNKIKDYSEMRLAIENLGLAAKVWKIKD